jgi:hypothetical protein
VQEQRGQQQQPQLQPGPPSVDFLSPSFDALLALSTEGLVPPVPDAPTLEYVAKFRGLIPEEGQEDAAAAPVSTILQQTWDVRLTACCWSPCSEASPARWCDQMHRMTTRPTPTVAVHRAQQRWGRRLRRLRRQQRRTPTLRAPRQRG